ncbi:MAG: TonB-dependent receptor [Schwartzia sp.]|nr:TonB-dependent receptor [Schwartzia sp. (in: firmicutes)]
MRKSHLAVSILAALTVALFSPCALAEDGDAAKGETLDTYTLDDTVVTATRVPVSRKEVSSAVEIITKEEIDAQGADNLADAIRYATGVTITQTSAQPGHKAVSIRGFDSRFSTILVDGKRVASEIDQNYELDRIPIDSIDHIEIVRGPSSSIHGTEAMGGVINIITKKTKDFSFSLSGDLSTWTGAGEKGPKRVGFFVDSGEIGKFSARITGFYRSNPTAFYRSDKTTYEPYGSWKHFGASLEYRPTERETILFTHSDTRENTTEYFYPSSTVLGIGKDLIDRHENSISYENKSDRGELFLRYYRTVMVKQRDNINSATGHLVGPNSWVRAHRTINAYEGHYTFKAGEHKLTLGGEYRPETFRGTAVTRNGGDFTAEGPEGRKQRGSTYHFYYSAAYLEDEWKVNDRLLAFISMRYDGNNHFDDNFSPKLGLTYSFDKNTRLKFNVARAFRSPTPNQLFQWNTSQMGNPDLDSETSFSYDISLEKEWKGKSAKLTFFDNRVRDYIGLVTTNPTLRWREYQNINRVTIRGIEAEYNAEIAPSLNWHSSWTWLDAKNKTTGERLENQPRHLLKSGLTWKAKHGFTADLETEFYNGYLANPGGSKSFALWNLVLSQKLGEGFTLRVGAENIFNKKDEDLALPGTLLKATLAYNF